MVGKWSKGIVEWPDADIPNLMNISVVFTWDAGKAFSRSVWLRQLGWDVRVGGPGVFTMKRDFAGVAEAGGDIDGTVQRHNPSATFASRGCPVGCYFCIVPAMEGRAFTLIPDFKPAPILCDNNLSALPPEYQDHIIERYKASGVRLRDANSGFEPKTFDADVLARWSAINRGPWRYAYDETSEGPDVERVCKMLAEYQPKIPANKKRVYVLIGNEPFEACMDRIREVIAWGAEPYAQPIMRLNARERVPWVRYEWTRPLLRQVQRWTNQWVWRKCVIEDYKPAKAAIAMMRARPANNQGEEASHDVVTGGNTLGRGVRSGGSRVPAERLRLE